MSLPVPWQTANVVGPKNALLLNPEHCAKLLKSAKRPLVVIGANATNPSVGLSDLPKYALLIARGIKSHIAASPTMQSKLDTTGGVQVFGMGLEDLMNRLKDRQWKGFDGKGGYDCVIMMGGIYYFESQMLSTLKHFAPNIKTVSLDRFYQPNATFSFPNMDVEKWSKDLRIITQELGGE